MVLIVKRSFSNEERKNWLNFVFYFCFRGASGYAGWDWRKAEEEKSKRKKRENVQKVKSELWFCFCCFVSQNKKSTRDQKSLTVWLGFEINVCLWKLFMPVSYDASEMLNQKSEKQKKVSQS